MSARHGIPLQLRRAAAAAAAQRASIPYNPYVCVSSIRLHGGGNSSSSNAGDGHGGRRVSQYPPAWRACRCQSGAELADIARACACSSSSPSAACGSTPRRSAAARPRQQPPTPRAEPRSCARMALPLARGPRAAAASSSLLLKLLVAGNLVVPLGHAHACVRIADPRPRRGSPPVAAQPASGRPAQTQCGAGSRADMIRSDIGRVGVVHVGQRYVDREVRP